MPADFCLLEVHKHVIHRIGAAPRVPLNQNAIFLAPKVASVQKRPQVDVAYQPHFL